MVTSIDCVIFEFNQGKNELLLRPFQLNQNNEPVYICLNVPAQTIHFLTQLLNNIPHAGENDNITKALCDFLEKSFAILENGANPVNHEKLAIMVIDDPLLLDIDPFTISNEFRRRDIISVVVASVTAADKISSFYDILTSKTGGHFMLLKNASTIFNDVISSVLAGKDTLREAFLRVRASEIDEKLAITHRINDMNEKTNN